MLNELVQLGRLGEPLYVGDGEADQQVHQDDGDQHREQQQEEMGRQGERLALHILY